MLYVPLRNRNSRKRKRLICCGMVRDIYPVLGPRPNKVHTAETGKKKKEIKVITKR